jgi:hypothetical protein
MIKQTVATAGDNASGRKSTRTTSAGYDQIRCTAKVFNRCVVLYPALIEASWLYTRELTVTVSYESLCSYARRKKICVVVVERACPAQLRTHLPEEALRENVAGALPPSARAKVAGGTGERDKRFKRGRSIAGGAQSLHVLASATSLAKRVLLHPRTDFARLSRLSIACDCLQSAVTCPGGFHDTAHMKGRQLPWVPAPSHIKLNRQNLETQSDWNSHCIWF